jgi:hypothetical protein
LLPDSWDIFVQTLQHDLDKLKDTTKWDEIARCITLKVVAEGQSLLPLIIKTMTRQVSLDRKRSSLESATTVESLITRKNTVTTRSATKKPNARNQRKLRCTWHRMEEITSIVLWHKKKNMQIKDG